MSDASAREGLRLRARRMMGVFDDEGEPVDPSSPENWSALESAGGFFAPGYTLYVNSESGIDQEGHLEFGMKLTQAFVPWRLDLEDEIVEGTLERGTVVQRWTGGGPQHNAYRDVAPTGIDVRFAGVTIHRFVNGLETERWVLFDEAGLLAQIRGSYVVHR